MANFTTNCQLYGQSLLGTRIYSEPCATVGATYYDFLFNVNEFYDFSKPVNDLTWSLYRRDTSISQTGTIDETHIFVDSGSTHDNFIRISLIDYGLRHIQTDYLLVVYKSSYIGHKAYTYIKYYPSNYTINNSNTPYHQVTLYLAKETSSGGMGGSVVTHTEYKDKPLPKIKITEMDECIEKKEIVVITIKEF